jgi:hypothetical protein
MRRSTFNPNNSSWTACAEKLRAAEQERAYETEDWPTPRKLFFEAGLVLTVALSAAFAASLFLGAR